MKFRVLTPQERGWLRQVETTEEQAVQIIERNSVVLEWFDELPTSKKDIYKALNDEPYGPKYGVNLEEGWDLGCPHCDRKEYDHFPCHQCVWKVLHHLNKRSRSNNVGNLYCIDVPFGGVRFTDVSVPFLASIMLSHDKISSEVNIPSNENDFNGYRTAIKLCQRFLIGHIEWCCGKLDGTL